jgi:hypothetical protein
MSIAFGPQAPQNILRQKPLIVCLKNFLPPYFDYAQIESVISIVKTIPNLEFKNDFRFADREWYSLNQSSFGKYPQFSLSQTERRLNAYLNKLYKHISKECDMKCESLHGVEIRIENSESMTPEMHSDETDFDTTSIKRNIVISLAENSKLTIFDDTPTIEDIEDGYQNSHGYETVYSDHESLIKECPSQKRGDAIVFDRMAAHASPVFEGIRVIAIAQYYVDTWKPQKEKAALRSFLAMHK